MRNGVVIALVALCAFAATLHAADKPTIAESEAFVTSALEKLRLYHVNRSRLDWNGVERTAIEKARAARSTGDLYEVVDGVIRDLGEPHSFLVRPRPSTVTTSPDAGATRKPPAIRTSLIGDVGYIDVPTFAGGGELAVAFAQEIRAALLKLDRAPLCGWIVDLRSNEGGNMHAPLLGLGRIVGEGRLGSVAGGASPQHWHYRSNQMIVSDLGDIQNLPVQETSASSSSPLAQGIRQTVALPSETKEVEQFELPLAVLIGRYTMSSGEGIAVSFIGRPLTRTFGHRTRGRSSANLGFKLSGGELLIVTYGSFADRSGNAHAPAVTPDEEVSQMSAVSTSSASDEGVATAARWIHRTNGDRECAAGR